jgi:alpha-mannosidase
MPYTAPTIDEYLHKRLMPVEGVIPHLPGVEMYGDSIPAGTQLDNSMAPATATGSFFSLSAENVVLLAFKPSADGNPEHYTLRLQEIAGKPADTKITTTWKVTEAVIVSMTEDEELTAATAQPLSVHLKPHETLTVRLTIPHPHKTRSARWWEW